MTDDELLAAIATALGWECRNPDPRWPWWMKPDGSGVKYLPDWLHSLDACNRDLLPVARERGWFGRWETDDDTLLERAWFWHRKHQGPVCEAPTGEIARALCMAWLNGPGKDGGQ